MAIVYNAEDFIGGGDNLDGMDGAALVDGMKAAVFSADEFAPYVLDDDAGGAENSPLKIVPDDNPGDKRWILTRGNFAGLKLYGSGTFKRDADDAVMFGLRWEKDREGAIVVNGDILGYFRYSGHDGVAYREAAEIEIRVDGVPGAGDMPGKILFKTTPAGGTSAVTRATIVEAGILVAGEVRSSGGYGFYTAQASGGYWFDHAGLRNDGMFYHQGDGAIIIRKGLSDITFVIAADRNIGFGTDNPSQKIDVYGAIAISGKRVAFRTGGATILGGCDAGDTKVTLRVGGNDRAFLDATGNFDVTGSYEVDSTKVVGNQGAAVANGTDPATTMARLNDLLARCRAHGLIAT